MWNEISEPTDVNALLEASEDRPQLIYKHSHRCSVCVIAQEELEKVADQMRDIADLYKINVIHQRKVSNAVASELQIRHESPQVILLKDGKPAWSGSHWEIKGRTVLERL